MCSKGWSCSAAAKRVGSPETTHVRFILNSSSSKLFLSKAKGGSGSLHFRSGIGMSPAQRFMYHFPKSWSRRPQGHTIAGREGGRKRVRGRRRMWSGLSAGWRGLRCWDGRSPGHGCPSLSSVPRTRQQDRGLLGGNTSWEEL